MQALAAVVGDQAIDRALGVLDFNAFADTSDDESYDGGGLEASLSPSGPFPDEGSHALLMESLGLDCDGEEGDRGRQQVPFATPATSHGVKCSPITGPGGGSGGTATAPEPVPWSVGRHRQQEHPGQGQAPGRLGGSSSLRPKHDTSLASATGDHVQVRDGGGGGNRSGMALGSSPSVPSVPSNADGAPIAVDPDYVRLRQSVSVLSMRLSESNARAEALAQQHGEDVQALQQALREVDSLRSVRVFVFV
jgi:hypothetical protein